MRLTWVVIACLTALLACDGSNRASSGGNSAASNGWKRADYKDAGFALELPDGAKEYVRIFPYEDNNNVTAVGKLIELNECTTVRMNEPIYLMSFYVFRTKGDGHETDKKENKFEFSGGTFKYNDTFGDAQETSVTLNGDEAFPYKNCVKYLGMRSHTAPNGDVILALGLLQVGPPTVASEQADRATMMHVLNSVKGSEE